MVSTLLKNSRFPVAVLGLLLLSVITFYALDSLVPKCEGMVTAAYSEIKKSWHDGDIFVVLRHTEKCTSADPKCPLNDEWLTEEGIEQARQIRNGLRKLGYDNVDVLHSPALRTTMTAEIVKPDTALAAQWLAEGCRNELLEKMKSQKRPGTNIVLITHSNCMNALKDERLNDILDFNVGKEAFYGISLLLRQGSDLQIEVLGCILPSQWDEAEPGVALR